MEVTEVNATMYASSSVNVRNQPSASGIESLDGLVVGAGTMLSDSGVEDTENAVSSREFINYLNQQRVAAGMSELSWDSTLEANALKRAKEIVSNFSHDGASYAEICYYGSSASYTDWYTSWYGSEGVSVVTDPDLLEWLESLDWGE